MAARGFTRSDYAFYSDVYVYNRVPTTTKSRFFLRPVVTTLIKLRLTDKRYRFGDTLAISGQVTTDTGQVTIDRQIPSCFRAGRRDGSDGTVITLETH